MVSTEDTRLSPRSGRIYLRAKDVMTAPVLTVQPDTDVKDIAAMMVAHHVSGLPVLTEEGDLVGIVTEGDLLHKETGSSRQDPRFLAGLPPFGQAAVAARKAAGLVARDLMTSPVITVDEETPLHEVAALIVRRKINRVPVLRGGRVTGIVSRADVVRALVRSDVELASAVRGALLHDLWVDVQRLHIAVRQGVVYLDGQVERRSERDLVERWVLTIDGVIGLESRLTYEVDDRKVARDDVWLRMGGAR